MISVVFVILSTVRKQLCKMWNGYLDLDQIFWININGLLTEREGRTGEYWPEVVAVRTSLRSVCTATTEGRGSSVSKLFIIWHSVSDSKMHFRWLALKGLPPCRILDDARNSDKSKLPRVRKTNLLNVKSSKISLNKTSKTLCNGIWQKQLLILKLEKGFLVDQTIFSWLQNMDQVSVKWSCEN